MGCSQANITPSWPVYIYGYASRNRLTAAVEDPIEAGVIALEQNGNRKLIITADLLGIKVQECRLIYDAIRSAVGIDFPDIFLSSSHTHFAPNFSGYNVYFADDDENALPIGNYPPDKRFIDFFLDKLIPAVRHALNDLEEVKLLQTEIPVSSIAFNRRTVRKADGGVTTNFVYPQDPENYNFSPIDPIMHIWKFMRGNTPKAVLARYGCHPVTGGYDFYGISHDYPGYFRRSIRQKMNCPAFFMLGTAGDVVPLRREGASRSDIGEVLADTVRLAEYTYRDTTDFVLKSTRFSINVHAPSLRGQTLDTLQTAWENELAKARREIPGKLNTDFWLAGAKLALMKEFGSADAQLDLQLLQLGNRVLVGLPFEVLTNIGVNIRLPHPDAAIISCTGGYEFYLPVQDDFAKGGYEVEYGTLWAPDTGNKVIASVIKALDKF